MSVLSLAESIAERVPRDFGAEPALPSERKLAEFYNCNRLTLRRALQVLADRGMLASSRRGHRLTEKAQNETAGSAPRSDGVIMVLCFEPKLLDHTHTYMIGGIFHAARLCGRKIVVRELTAEMVKNMRSCAEIDDGFEVAGYLVAGQAPMRLHDLLSDSMKPCVINGTFDGEEQFSGRIRFMEVHIDYTLLFQNVASRLISMGHRRILLAHANAGFMYQRIRQGVLAAYRAAGLPESLLHEKICPVDIFRPGENIRAYATELVEAARDCTAVLLPCGNVFGLEVVRAFQDRHIRIPEDLSLVMLGYEPDYFIPVYGISGIFGDVRELGAFCMKELCRQLDAGRPEYGIVYFSTTFVDRGSVAPVGANVKK